MKKLIATINHNNIDGARVSIYYVDTQLIARYNDQEDVMFDGRIYDNEDMARADVYYTYNASEWALDQLD